MKFKNLTLRSLILAGLLGTYPDLSANVAGMFENSEISSSQSKTDKESEAKSKMNELKKLISKAKKAGVNTLKEETALRTAEIFLGYAEWDENNIDENIKNFSLVTKYKKEPEKYAKLLPDFERQEIIEMMNSSMKELNDVMSGKIKRLPVSVVDWKKVKVDKDMLLYKGKPVFLADWTWKPRIKEYCDYHGDLDGFFITNSNVINEKGDITPFVLKQLKEKEDGSLGFVFVNHSNFPKWAEKKDPTVKDGPGLKYIMYDINNPLSRKVNSDLIKGTVPYMAGKQYTGLGYMLCNEPHWNSIEKTWASAPISEYAYAEFRKWLKKKHGSINQLNKLWGTSFKDFDSVDGPRIMKADMQGTPMYFDFMSFNMDRVTDWFSFLKNEIKKYDPQAKTHIKLMPNLWSENKRDSGIDLEALTRNSEIIGNDASSCGAWMWGKPKFWEANYAFDWTEICMAYDFMKSVSPDKLMFNTEGHMLSTGKYRDLYQSKEYARGNYWLATIHGLTASQTWYWCRREDGSSRPSSDSNGYAASNNHQPRIVNEVHATMIDLNSVSDDIMAFQRQRKPIRIFYTKASSINKPSHMTDIFKVYEKLNFNGLPIGFATEGIIKNNPHEWDAMVIFKTPYAFKGDLKAVQSYLNEGGTVIMDNASFKTDEYGRPLGTKLNKGKGKLIVINSLDELKNQALATVKSNKGLPDILVKETNDRNKPGCEWRVLSKDNGKYIVNIVNIGKSDAVINMTAPTKKINKVTDILTGVSLEAKLTMKPNEVRFLEVDVD